MTLPFENPFASRFIQPGALEYFFFDGNTLETVVDRFLNTLDGNAAVVGPHGSGKSTLIRSLIPVILRNGRFRCEFDYRLTSHQKKVKPILDEAKKKWNPESLVVIDGFEQLNFLARLWIRFYLVKSRCGLLITTHQPVKWLSTLWETSIDEPAAEFLTRKLLINQHELIAPILNSQEWIEARQKWGPNLREVFFELYDLVEDLESPQRKFERSQPST